MSFGHLKNFFNKILRISKQEVCTMTTTDACTTYHRRHDIESTNKTFVLNCYFCGYSCTNLQKNVGCTWINHSNNHVTNAGEHSGISDRKVVSTRILFWSTWLPLSKHRWIPHHCVRTSVKTL